MLGRKQEIKKPVYINKTYIYIKIDIYIFLYIYIHTPVN